MLVFVRFSMFLLIRALKNLHVYIKNDTVSERRVNDQNSYERSYKVFILKSTTLKGLNSSLT